MISLNKNSLFDEWTQGFCLVESTTQETAHGPTRCFRSIGLFHRICSTGCIDLSRLRFCNMTTPTSTVLPTRTTFFRFLSQFMIHKLLWLFISVKILGKTSFKREQLTLKDELLDPWSRREKSCFNRLCFFPVAEERGRQLQLSWALLPPASSIATSWIDPTAEGIGSMGREVQVGLNRRTIADDASASLMSFKLLQLFAGTGKRPATAASGSCNKSERAQSTRGTISSLTSVKQLKDWLALKWVSLPNPGLSNEKLHAAFV